MKEAYENGNPQSKVYSVNIMLDIIKSTMRLKVPM
jgi:hypothetical protein